MAAAALWYFLAPVAPALRAGPALCGARLRAGFRLGDRDLVLLSIAYFLHSAVFFVFIFWFFRYLRSTAGA
ncbi:MAG: hypothetical protein R2882_10230 [Gemmatimonadales bacterium]